MLKILNPTESSSFKDSIALYALSGSLILLGTSWALMFGTIITNNWKNKNHPQ